MSQPNFDNMTRHELLTYVRSHPDDTEAFHRDMDLLQTLPGRKLRSDDQSRRLIGTNNRAIKRVVPGVCNGKQFIAAH
ncbi:DUF6887 family protein [Nostoc sp.]